MFITETVVIGAGHAGLAVSRLLADSGRDHVVLDRGQVAERWRSERWDSLHLLTPNWMTRLPGWHYRGYDSEGYMSVSDFVDYLEGYADSFSAPVRTGTTVLEVTATDRGYRVVTDQGTWRTKNVVVATGPWGKPRVPGCLDLTGSDLRLTTASAYRNPQSLPDGGVLVIGASSSGVQIADELSRAGRDVVLAVGRHTRMPRRYRGMDIFWWLERTGRLARTIDEVRDPVAARQEPSIQLVGRNEPDRFTEDLDLAALVAQGVRVTGRLGSLTEGIATFQDNLQASVAESDHRMHRFLDKVDAHVDASGLGSEVWAAVRPRPFVAGAAPSSLDLRAEGVGTVLLATGYAPSHPWLQVPVTGRDGSIIQDRGITAAPGLYVVGQRFQHRRDSGFIDGARHDAAAVVEHIASTRVLDPALR
ncbi:MAG TPA: NAD(P)-binding domain-containing protein [Nocardioidaceae bacterium]|nr:NAD(P)-binding domain-containing protein [Nocardioidaceae bacterium]